MTPKQTDRRTALKLIGTTTAIPFLLKGSIANAQAPLTVGILYSGPKQDYGYNQSHAKAAEALKNVAGVKVVEEERVPETIAAQRTMEGMILQDGAKLIIATSYGYFKPHLQEVAAKHPDVTFAHCGGVWAPSMPENIGTFFGHIFSAEYVSGIVAGHMTKTLKLGIVAAKPLPNLVRSINAFAMAARSVNPAIVVQVIFTGDWMLPVREADSTNALIDQGADVITCLVDSPKVVIATAEKRGVMSCGFHASQADIAPKGYLTGAEWTWISPYLQFVQAVREGKKPTHDVRGGLSERFVQNTAYGPAVSQTARAAADRARDQLISGSLQIYAGPLKDNKGNTVVPAGTIHKENDPVLDNIDYLVEGVIGQI